MDLVSEAIRMLVVGVMLPVFDAFEPRVGAFWAFAVTMLMPLTCVQAVAVALRALDRRAAG